MNTSSVDINGEIYQLSKLSPMDQFHVVRRLAPVMAGVGDLISKVVGVVSSGSKEEIEDLFNGALGPLSEAISGMKDDDVTYIVKKCLERCLRMDRTSGRGAPILVAGVPEVVFMFSDINGVVMLRLVVETIKAEISSFF